MADEVDQTQEREERILAMNIAASARAVPVIVATGKCRTCCKEIHEEGRRWCDSACRDTWEDSRFNR